MSYYTYITTNPKKTVLYTGMTNDLASRVIEHFNSKGEKSTFAGRYYCYFLIYYEAFQFPHQAIEHEKEIKRMSRVQKEHLIKLQNPKLDFLNSTIMNWPPHPDQTYR